MQQEQLCHDQAREALCSSTPKTMRGSHRRLLLGPSLRGQCRASPCQSIRVAVARGLLCRHAPADRRGGSAVGSAGLVLSLRQEEEANGDCSSR